MELADGAICSNSSGTRPPARRLTCGGRNSLALTHFQGSIHRATGGWHSQRGLPRQARSRSSPHQAIAFERDSAQSLGPMTIGRKSVGSIKGFDLRQLFTGFEARSIRPDVPVVICLNGSLNDSRDVSARELAKTLMGPKQLVSLSSRTTVSSALQRARADLSPWRCTDLVNRLKYLVQSSTLSPSRALSVLHLAAQV